MFKLIQNEFLKLHAKKSIYILLGVLAVLEIAVAICIKQWGPSGLQFASFLSFSNKMFGMVEIFATVFGITLASRTITDEFQKGTIKQLLARPRKRITILFSKYLTVVLSVIVVCIISLAVAILIGIATFGWGKEEITGVVLLKSVTYKILPMLFYATIAFFLANVFRKSVLSLIVSISIFFVQKPISMLLMVSAGNIAKFNVFPHLNLEVYEKNILINGGTTPPFADFNFTTSLSIVVIYFAALLIASSLLFQKRDVL